MIKNIQKTAAFIDSLGKAKNKLVGITKSVFTTPKVIEHFDYHPHSYNYLVKDQHLFPFGAKAFHEKAYRTFQQELGSSYLDDLENALINKNQDFLNKAPDEINKVRAALSDKPRKTQPDPWYKNIF